MQEIREPSIFVPMYMVNAEEDVIDKYLEVNGTDAVRTEGSITTYYNQAWPLRKVIVEDAGTVDAAALINAAYYNMFVKAMRVPVLPQALVSAGAPYSGYNFDEAPVFAVRPQHCHRCARTEDGIYLIKHQNDTETFASIRTSVEAAEPGPNSTGTVDAGEYIDVWYEYLPEEVLDGTAAEGSIPLILCNHGGGDDARVFVEEVRPARARRPGAHRCWSPRTISSSARSAGRPLTAVVEYMLETYPALDASRVYATGYSMGSMATHTVANYSPKTFAAIAPIAGAQLRQDRGTAGCVRDL